MTKVNIFDLSNRADKEPEVEVKYIEFTKMLRDKGECFSGSYCEPYEFDNVVLLFQTPHGYDMMMAWDDGKEPTIYKGHWNDGVVE